MFFFFWAGGGRKGKVRCNAANRSLSLSLPAVAGPGDGKLSERESDIRAMDGWKLVYVHVLAL